MLVTELPVQYMMGLLQGQGGKAAVMSLVEWAGIET